VAEVRAKPQVTPRASWGTRNGSITIAPIENDSPSVNGRTGQEPGDRERTFFEKPSRFFRWRWIGISNRAQHPPRSRSRGRYGGGRPAERPRRPGAVGLREGGHETSLGWQPRVDQQDGPACSTSVRFPELPLRNGVTWNPTAGTPPLPYGAYLVKTKSFPLTLAWWHGKQVA